MQWSVTTLNCENLHYKFRLNSEEKATIMLFSLSGTSWVVSAPIKESNQWEFDLGFRGPLDLGRNPSSGMRVISNSFPFRIIWSSIRLHWCSVYQGFDTVFFNDGSKIGYGIEAEVFSDTPTVGESYGIPSRGSLPPADGFQNLNFRALLNSCWLLIAKAHHLV